MHVWIDVDNPKHVPLVAQVIKELKERGHAVTLTAPRSKAIKKELEVHGLKVRFIGFVFSFFGLLLNQSNIFRTALMSDYIKIRNIDIASSLGSKTLLYLCSTSNIPMILLVENIEEKIDAFYLGYEKCFFIVHDFIHDQNLIEKGFDLNKTQKVKEMKAKDVTNKIEFFNHRIAQTVQG